MAPLASSDEATLLLTIPPLPSFPISAVHEVRIRRNSPKIPTANDARSLFLKNVPADSTEAHLRAVFASLVGHGRFESVTFGDERRSPLATDPGAAVRLSGMKRKRDQVDAEERAREEDAAQLPEIWTRRPKKSGGTAVVLLADEKSVQLVLKAIAKSHRTKKYPVWGENVPESVPPLGATWVSSHLKLSRPDRHATQQAVHAFFKVFDRKEKEAAELAKRLRNEPDEDGFVTVTRGGRNAPASKSEAEAARQRMMEKQAKKKEEMRGFYRFQLRERRKAQQLELVKKFEEDQKKVSSMKEKRGKFRPET